MATAYMWVICILCNGLRVEDTETPETAAVPTVAEEGESKSEQSNRKQKDRQRDSANTNDRQITTIANAHLDGTGGIIGAYNPGEYRI